MRGQVWPTFGPESILGPPGSTLGHASDFGSHFAPTSARLGQLGPTWAETRLTYAEFGRCREFVQVRPKSARIRPNLASVWPNCANFGPKSADVGQSWTEVVRPSSVFAHRRADVNSAHLGEHGDPCTVEGLGRAFGRPYKASRGLRRPSSALADLRRPTMLHRSHLAESGIGRTWPHTWMHHVTLLGTL